MAATLPWLPGPLCGSSRQGLSSPCHPCLSPGRHSPTPERYQGMWAFVQSTNHTQSQAPLQTPSVARVLQKGAGGREPGGVTFLGTVMTIGSHLRSCSL